MRLLRGALDQGHHVSAGLLHRKRGLLKPESAGAGIAQIRLAPAGAEHEGGELLLLPIDSLSQPVYGCLGRAVCCVWHR